MDDTIAYKCPCCGAALVWGSKEQELVCEYCDNTFTEAQLKEILEERDISLNQLSFRAEMQRTQLRNYRDNKIQRLDIDILNRLCYVLECDLNDLIEYIPPETE